MKKTKNRLIEWVEKGFLTDQQKDQILTYENSKERTNKSAWILYGFITLGVSVLAIGLVSIIAANWEDIPGSIKLFIDFGLLIGLSLGIYKASIDNREILFDALSVFFVLLCLASIGLISQVYHTGGQIYQALLTWIIIIFPLSFFGKRSFLPHLWVLGCLTTIIVWATSADSWWADSNTGYFNYDNLIAILLALPGFCLFLGSIFAKIKELKRFGKGFNFWVFITGLVAIVTVDIYISFTHYHDDSYSFAPVYLFCFLGLITFCLRLEYGIKAKVVVGLITGLTLVLVYYQSSKSFLFGEEFNQFVSAGYTIATLLFMAIYFVINNVKKMFHVMTILAGIRFLIVYFQVLGDLAMTGEGLILSGIVIVGATIAWYKTKDKLEQWIGAIMK